MANGPMFPVDHTAGWTNTPERKVNLFSGITAGVNSASPTAKALLHGTGDRRGGGGGFDPPGTEGAYDPTTSATAAEPAVETPELTVLKLDQYKDYVVYTGTRRTHEKGYVGSSQEDADFQKYGGAGTFSYIPTAQFVPEAVLAFRKQSLDEPDKYQRTVQQLVRSGYLSPKDATFSAYTTKVGQAYLDALLDISSNQQDNKDNVDKIKSIDQWLDTFAEEKDQDHDGLPDYLKSEAKVAPQIQNVWTDPEAVKASVNSVAENLLGRKLTADEAAEFASAFHGKEAQFNAARNDFDATQIDVTNPDLGAEAQGYVEDNYGAQIDVQADAQYIEALMQMLGG